MENFPHLPTLLSVGAAVIVLTLVLNQFLFKPLRAIIDERQRRSEEARGKLEEAQATQAQRLDEIEARLREARREAHETREQALRAGRARRDELMGEARQQAHALVEEARASDIEVARKDLETEARRLSEMITERVLGRPVGKAGESDR
jgi:F-type H+-transporting ATPase subunit b